MLTDRFILGMATGVDIMRPEALLGGAQRAMTYGGNLAKPNVYPSYGELVYLWQMGYVHSTQLQDIARQLGYDMSALNRASTRIGVVKNDGVIGLNIDISNGVWKLNDKVALLSNKQLSIGSIYDMLNRGLIDVQLARFFILLSNGGETAIANALLQMTQSLPGLGQLVDYANKGLFDIPFVAQLGLADNTPYLLNKYAKQTGQAFETELDVPPSTDDRGQNNAGRKATFADMAYWASRELPSIGQAYEMFHRLYDSSRYGASPESRTGGTFTRQQLELLLNYYNIPKTYWGQLMQISYKPISIRFIKMLIQYGLLKEDQNNHDAYHLFRQMGYDDANAVRLSQLAVLTANKDIVDESIKTIDKYYKQGIYTKQAAVAQLMKLRYSNADATLHMELIDTQLISEELELTLRSLKRAFFNGDLSLDDLKARLVTIGISLNAQNRYVRIWQMQLETTHKYVSMEKSLTLYKKGYIVVQQLYNKLINLHYTDAEIKVLIREANDEIALAQAKAYNAIETQLEKAQAKVTAAATKVLKEQQLANLKQQKTLEKSATDAHNKMLKAYTDSNMRKWYKEGLITDNQIIAILQMKGWQTPAIDAWLFTQNQPTKGSTTNAP